LRFAGCSPAIFIRGSKTKAVTNKMFNKEDIKNAAQNMVRHKQTIAVAESVTAGFLQAAFASADNASLFFQGGITTYNIKQKYTHLHIHLEHAIACNCVSEQLAAEMAVSVCKLFSTDWGIGITGYASPIPEQHMEKLFACFAIAFKKNIVLTKTIDTGIKPAYEVQVEYVNAVIAQFLEVATMTKIV
jgi:nicotinamide-nucleotide amidase